MRASTVAVEAVVNYLFVGSLMAVALGAALIWWPTWSLVDDWSGYPLEYTPAEINRIAVASIADASSRGWLDRSSPEYLKRPTSSIVWSKP